MSRCHTRLLTHNIMYSRGLPLALVLIPLQSLVPWPCVYIWVRFPRTGILAKMWSLFWKSRAFVWLNLIIFYGFSIVSVQVCPLDPRNTFVWPWNTFISTLQNPHFCPKGTNRAKQKQYKQKETNRKQSNSGSRRAKEEPKKGKLSKFNGKNDGQVKSSPAVEGKSHEGSICTWKIAFWGKNEGFARYL